MELEDGTGGWNGDFLLRKRFAMTKSPITWLAWWLHDALEKLLRVHALGDLVIAKRLRSKKSPSHPPFNAR